jgi:diguanylate cyclase (GGDEF)-like protein
MTEGRDPGHAPCETATRNLLHQQLITVKARLDRQVQQLMRMNQLSNHLLGSIDSRAMTEAFAEAIVDVLDMAVGAVWVLPPQDATIRPPFAVFGAEVEAEAWSAAGPDLAALLGGDDGARPAAIGDDLGALLPGLALVSPIACRCIGRDGRTVAVLLAANTAKVAGMSEPVTAESMEMLAVLAEKCSAHIDHFTDRRRYESDIHQLAYFDPLTELPNRRLLSDRIRQSLRRRDRTGQFTAVLMLDVDRFKRLNDTHGHAAGDQLLRAVSDRLRELVRPYDTVSRLGGDEFVVMIEQLGSDRAAALATAERTAVKLLVALDEPYSIDVGVTHHSVSIGVAVSSGPADTAEGLLKAADVAMYAAKEAGRNMVRVFQPEMQQRVDRRSALESRLRAAFERSEIEVHYQAQVGLDGALAGAEALMRWEGPGIVAAGPGEFIPVAEESGFIHELGQWNLETACRQAARWEPLLPPDFRIAVNLAAAEFMHPDFTGRVIESLQRTGTPGRRIRLEITEATIVTELGFAADRMHRLRAHDIEFSLDDFGAGYSSLTYLRRLPVSEVKIDQSFVQRVLSDRHDAAIVRAILAMCESLDLRVVAEGVESRDVRDRLAEYGCRYFQGYLFGRPARALQDPARLVAADG